MVFEEVLDVPGVPNAAERYHEHHLLNQEVIASDIPKGFQDYQEVASHHGNYEEREDARSVRFYR